MKSDGGAGEACSATETDPRGDLRRDRFITPVINDGGGICEKAKDAEIISISGWKARDGGVRMDIVCLDLEGVLVPEDLIAFSEATEYRTEHHTG